MPDRYAVIDLGTNTFHLLIANYSKDGFEYIYRERIFVQLAENGIQTIGETPFQRGLDALAHFRKILDQHEVKAVNAFGTAALRTASNSAEFQKAAQEQTGISINIISGDQEAQLIYKGVQQVVPFDEQNSLIMDIGGGSVEFIIANKSGVQWAQSFPIGVAVLHHQFHKNDPILNEEITQIHTHLSDITAPLLKALATYSIFNLIGASGTFDVIENILAKEQFSDYHSIVPTAKFPTLYQSIIQSTQKERLARTDIPDSRAQLIVVAIILIDFIIQKASIQQIDVSSFAMKEGILSEMVK